MKREPQLMRLTKIKALLEDKAEISTREIMQLFHVSFDTARRDIIHLDQTGQAIRVHGGLMRLSDSGAASYNTRTHIKSPLKMKMARLIVPYIKSNGLYFFSCSTTITQLCEQVAGVNAHIVTNSIDNASILIKNNLPHAELLGGEINVENHYTYSLNSLQALDNYNFDLAVIGAAAVKKDGLYLVNENDAVIDRKAVSRAKKVLAVAENYKFAPTRRASYRIVPGRKIDILVTDQPLKQEQRQIFSHNLKIKTVSKGEEK